MNLSFRPAQSRDVMPIVELVNSGYRGDASRAGWTTEADYLEGVRTDEAEVRALIADANSVLLLCEKESELIGSVLLQRNGDAVYLGMFVVRPTLQGRGIGKAFIDAAENYARVTWAAKKMEMTVITLRHELITYYERRGYRRTGVLKPFPVEDKRSSLRVADLQFEVLEKSL